MTHEVSCLGSGLPPEEEAKVRASESDVQAQAWSADYKGATVRDIPSNAYTYANRGAAEIDMIVIHFTQGTSFAPIAFGPGGLAHYGTGYNGAVDQYIQERHIAYHAGNWPVNQRSVGIEHVGYGRVEDWTDAMLNGSAKLSADICKRRGVPIDRQHIVGHVEVSGPGGHWDPGKHFPWTRYMELVKKYYSGSAPTPPQPSGTLYVRTKDALPAGKAIYKTSSLDAAKKEQARLRADHGIETVMDSPKA